MVSASCVCFSWTGASGLINQSVREVLVEQTVLKICFRFLLCVFILFQFIDLLIHGLNSNSFHPPVHFLSHMSYKGLRATWRISRGHRAQIGGYPGQGSGLSHGTITDTLSQTMDPLVSNFTLKTYERMLNNLNNRIFMDTKFTISVFLPPIYE